MHIKIDKTTQAVLINDSKPNIHASHLILHLTTFTSHECTITTESCHGDATAVFDTVRVKSHGPLGGSVLRFCIPQLDSNYNRVSK